MNCFRFRALKFIELLALSGVVLLFTHCASEQTQSGDPEGLYKKAEEALKDEQYLTALETYRTLKNRYPYHSRATDAELRIADTYFAEESFIEAASAYEVFRELHPSYPRIDYVQYRLALSYYQQIPDVAARDLSSAYRAQEEFGILIRRYPNSQYVNEAKDLQKKVRLRLAEREDYVASFYYDRKHYLSASFRYQSLLTNFANLGYDETALYRLGECYYHIRMFGNAREALQQFVNRFPDSQHLASAKALLSKLKKN